MWEKFKEHILEVLLTIIVTGFGSFLTFQLGQIKSDIHKVESKVVCTAVSNQLVEIERKLMEATVDLIDPNDPCLRSLKKLETDYKDGLEKSPEGSALFDEIQCLHDGLDDYSKQEFEEALKQFSKLERQKALTERLLGATKLSISTRTSDKVEKAKLEEQAENDFKQATTLAAEEYPFEKLEDTMLRMKVNMFIAQNTPDGNKQAIQTLQQILDKGYGRISTYYNMAAMNSRLANYKDCLTWFQKFLDHGGTERERGKTMKDPDFENFILTSSSAPAFRKLLDLMQP